jgi:hypothetical protein
VKQYYCARRETRPANPSARHFFGGGDRRAAIEEFSVDACTQKVRTYLRLTAAFGREKWLFFYANFWFFGRWRRPI